MSLDGIVPFHDYVLVEKVETQTASGLYMPPGAETGKPQVKVRVLKVGPGIIGPDGKPVPPDVKEGNEVYVNSGALRPFEGDGFKCELVFWSHRDVVAGDYR